MAEQTQDEGGIGVSGYVGGAAGGIAAGHFMQRHLANKGIGAVLTAKEPTGNFAKLVTETLAKPENSALPAAGVNIAGLKVINHAEVDAVHFVMDEATKSHTMKVTMKKAEGVADTVIHEIKNIPKLPEGIKAGDAVAADKIAGLFEGEKSFVKTTIAKMEGQLANGIRKASGYFSGIKNVSWGGKTAIIGATVAGVAAAGYAANAMFSPSKHTARLEAQENAPATGNAR